MSAIPAYRCDFCGAETWTSPANTILYETGESQMDPSGHGYIRESVRLDFCVACSNRALREYAKANPEKWRTIK